MQEFEERFAKAIATLKEDSQSKPAVNELCTSFYVWLAESVGEVIRESGDIDKFIEEHVNIMDFGLSSLVDVAAMKTVVADSDLADCRMEVRTISKWLKDLLLKIRSGDKVQKLEHDLKLKKVEHGKIMTEIKNLQNERRAAIEAMFFRPTDPAKQLASLESTEELQLEEARKKKEIAKGAFLSAEQKRERVKYLAELQKKIEFSHSFINTLPKKEGPAEMKKITKTIVEELFIKLVDIESVMQKISEELEAVQKKSTEMPLSEIEAKVTEELEYIRDLIKLSAQRSSLDPLPVLRPEDKPMSLSVLGKNLNQITEFDPHIFHNDRVPLFGRPYIFLVPGTGNAIFDWKNNCIVMPTIAPGANFMGSLATGIVEYRLDVDEEKKILTSYNQLPDLKQIRSIITLKARLIKEYIIWMTKEYNGYRILSKESMLWFEQEIGPSKNDIFTPLEFQSYTMTSQEFNKLIDDVTGRIKEAEDNGTEPSAEDLWAGGLLFYQLGKPEKALPLLEKYVKLKPDHLMAWYNLGFVAMKQMNRSLAREAFDKYCKMDTQTWWSKVVRGHMRNLGPAT